LADGERMTTAAADDNARRATLPSNAQSSEVSLAIVPKSGCGKRGTVLRTDYFRRSRRITRKREVVSSLLRFTRSGRPIHRNTGPYLRMSNQNPALPYMAKTVPYCAAVPGFTSGETKADLASLRIRRGYRNHYSGGGLLSRPQKQIRNRNGRWSTVRSLGGQRTRDARFDWYARRRFSRRNVVPHESVCRQVSYSE
jgi:hypothetical protein